MDLIYLWASHYPPKYQRDEYFSISDHTFKFISPKFRDSPNGD